jgi:hypothetical protein
MLGSGAMNNKECSQKAGADWSESIYECAIFLAFNFPQPYFAAVYAHGMKIIWMFAPN